MQPLMRLAARDAWARAGITPLQPRARVVSPWNVDRDAHGRIEVCDLGRVRLAKIRANPMCIEQRCPAAGEASSCYKVLLQVSGRSLVQQNGREAMLSPGDWTLYGDDRAFAVVNFERSEQRMVIVPRSELWGGMLDLEALTVRQFAAQDGSSSRQLIGFFDTAFDAVSLFGAEAAGEVAGIAVHLSRLALIENAGTRLHRSHSEVMRDRVRDYVERNLRDPDLSVSTIAAALNCSTRYLHKVFADGDETVAQYILNRRLDKCLGELTGMRRHGTSIAELAYGWGFRSLSHFGKAFTRRYGVTPGQRRILSGSQD